MATPRRFELDEAVNRPGTYFNPTTEMLLVVDDSAALDPDAPASPYPPEPQVVDAPDYRYGDTSSEGRPR